MEKNEGRGKKKINKDIKFYAIIFTMFLNCILIILIIIVATISTNNVKVPSSSPSSILTRTQIYEKII